MRISFGASPMLLVVGIGGLVFLAILALKWARRAKAPEPPPPLAPLSTLSGLSFLSAIGAMLPALAALGCTWTARYRDTVGLGGGDVHDLMLAAQILAWVTIVAAVGTLALAIAARGAVRESRGALRGRSLYHSAVLVALLSCAGVWAYLA